KLISSHLDKYVNNYFGDEYEYSKKFIFLQHGVTHNDLSNWFNDKKNLHCVITATLDEYHSIVDNYTKYKLTEKEVVLTGFPRHDSLLKYNTYKKTILIMPTWRNSIVGKNISGSNERLFNNEFMETEYAKSWYNFIHSKNLELLIRTHNYNVIFAPHANIVPYLEQFHIPSYISVWTISDQIGSMQELFQASSIMITDYSSVAFEMAYLEKAIIYYQFDKESIYQGGHFIKKCYFEYKRDG